MGKCESTTLKCRAPPPDCGGWRKMLITVGSKGHHQISAGPIILRFHREIGQVPVLVVSTFPSVANFRDPTFRYFRTKLPHHSVDCDDSFIPAVRWYFSPPVTEGRREGAQETRSHQHGRPCASTKQSAACRVLSPGATPLHICRR